MDAPPYREATRPPWRVRRVAKSGPMLGYVSGWTVLPPSTLFWAFDRATGDPRRPWRVWMSDHPGEREMHQVPVQHAFGHVVVAGLGMGLATWEMCRNPAVERVTVLERDHAVIDLWNAHGIDLPKLSIVQCDALAPPELTSVDLLYADIWLRYGQRDNVADTRKMAAKLRPKQVYIWGQEHNIAAWAREQGRPNDRATCRNFARSTLLPLLGHDLPDYPDFVRRAVTCLDTRLRVSMPHPSQPR